VPHLCREKNARIKNHAERRFDPEDDCQLRALQIGENYCGGDCDLQSGFAE